MKTEIKLMMVKSLHTLIWVFFNVVIFYMLYAAVINKLDKWLWTGFALVTIEGAVLLIFRLRCPLTLIASKYSKADQDNFDIYLPNWLARFTKLIYTTLVAVIACITIYQLVK